MQTGAITQYIDVAQIVLYLFWVFFAGLVYYLHRENKREGYPLESDRSAHITVQGYPAVPEPKTFLLRDGTTRIAPNPNNMGSSPNLKAEPIAAFPGAALEPTGNPMLDGVGPGAYADRPDVPDMTFEGVPKIVPLRIATDFHLSKNDPNPVGMDVIGADDLVGGEVTEVWVDRSECLIRFLEVRVPLPGNQSRQVMVPLNFCRIGREVNVRSILADQFVDVPGIRNPESITLMEEERIMAYFGGGTLYATPARQEPLI
jgi:photosynthetic reaction center H subunit